MFIDEITYRIKLWRLRRSQRSVSAFYARQIEEARKAKKTHDDLQMIWTAEGSEYDLAEEEIRQLQSRYLNRAAHDLFLPNDLEPSDWEEGYITGARYITLDAANRLESAIRAKTAEARQVWLPLVSGLTGILGALTGLLAIILRK